nr:choice-of-anchor D domain-containing protein [uncultured Draconibacterium sp.]
MKNIYLLFLIALLNVGTVEGADFEQTYDGSYHSENEVSTVSQKYTFRVKNVPNGYYHRIFVNEVYDEDQGYKKETLYSNPSFSVYIYKNEVKKIEIQILDDNYNYISSHEWYFKEPPPSLSVTKNVKDFGDVTLGSNPSTKTFTFSINNDGGGTLTGKISTSASWLRVSSETFSLTATQGKQITVTATTTGLAVGDHSSKIYITSNGSDYSWTAATVNIVKTTGDLKIQVKNARGNLQANAKVILFENLSDSWHEISDKKYTNSSGETSYWELPAGAYNAEVYYDGGGGNEFWVSAWDDSEGAITLNAGDSKTYTMQRNEPYAYDYKVFDDTGNEITGEEIPVGTTITHRVYITNTSSTDRVVMVKICSNKDKNTDWNYSSNAVEIASNSNLSFDLEQTIEEAVTYYRKVKVETLVHSYTQTDWWNWDTSVTGKEKVAADISIDPISSVTRGVQFKVTCNVTNSGSSSRTFNVGAEIKDGETKLYSFAARETPTIAAGQTEQVPYYYTIPDDWEPKEYTFNAAVWDGTPGAESREWLAGDDETFTVNNPDAAQIIEFTVPTGTVQRESTQQIKVKIKNTGITTRSFWVGLSFAQEYTEAESWPNGWYDIYPQKSKTLYPDEVQEIVFSFKIPLTWDKGQYYATTAIWDDFDETNFIMIGKSLSETNQFDIPFDRLTRHSDLIDKPDIGKLSFNLPFVENSLTLPNYFANLIYQVEQKPISELYNSGKKPLIYLSGGVQVNFLGTNVTEGLIMFIDVADMYGYTPEGKEGWTTIWVANQLKGASYTIKKSIDNKPVEFDWDAGVIFHDFDFTQRGIADFRDDKLEYGKFSVPGFTLTIFTNDRTDDKISWLKLSSGASMKRIINFDSSFTGADAINYLKKFEIKTSILINAFNPLSTTLPSSFKGYADYIFNYINEFKDNPEILRNYSTNDGYWEMQKGIAIGDLSMRFVEDLNSSMHLFKINIPKNAKNLTITASGGTGGRKIIWRCGAPFLDEQSGNFKKDGASDTDGNGNAICKIDNPQNDSYYIGLALSQNLNGYENVSLVANYETEESPATLQIMPDNTWDYGDVTIASNSDKTFLLQNTGSTDLSISDITISGTNSNQFKILSPTSTSFDIASQASIEINVRFSPTSSGSKTAQLEISNNSDNASPIKTVTISGTGKEVQTFAITTTVNPSEGGTATGDGNYELGKTCNLTAIPESGYVFLSWTENGTQVATNASYSFTVTSDRTLIANFEAKTFNISASSSPSNGGSVSGAGSYNYGGTANLTATAAEGYDFVDWTEDGTTVSTNANYVFTVTSDRTLIANFEAKTFNISASSSPSNGGGVSGAGSYNNGATANLIATAAEGYDFVDWTEDGTTVSTNASYSFTVTSDRTLIANFEAKTFNISASSSPSNGGSVSGAGSYNYGGTANLIATAAEGYDFVDWTEDGTTVSTNVNYSFTVTSDRTLVANFEAKTFNISASASPSNGGIVSGAGSYNNGGTANLTATAVEGYDFIDWTEDGTVVSTNANYSFTVTSDRTLVANFETKIFNISASASPDNGGSVTGAGSYNHGATATLTATAADGYGFINWTESGLEVSTNADYSFTVIESRTLIANFDNTVGVSDIDESIGIDVYPNPAEGELTIEFSTIPQKYAIEFYNSLGQRVLHKQSTSQIEVLDLEKFPGGIYYLKLYNKEFSQTERIVVR